MNIEITPGLAHHQLAESSPPDTRCLVEGFGRQMSSCLDPQRPVLYLDEDLPSGSLRLPHEHVRGQLAWAATGVLRVNTDAGSWLVPPSHAVWITGGLRHEILVVSPASIRYLFVDPSVCERLPDVCQVMSVTPLLRELILRLLTFDLSVPAQGKPARLIQVLLDELAGLETSPLHLPVGQDRRLLAVMNILINNPADSRSLPQLAAVAGASPRTLERLFRSEAGLSFRQWRARLRLMEAVQRLGKGESSAAIALSLGYASSSAFVAAFRRYFGQPPQRFAHQGGA
ncbi:MULTISPECIES: helix-turn-helix domain-containing protein [unclassified Oceanobacter]|uniref:AraC family transcriptional regulator n=1 Tax=unclassified Oceanobacter TaxID=2620260 RepID=UPI0026E36B03|nr:MULTISPECIES: helix-turn-helix transcriptional regulator [unclassified Oceanobacter]MDO6683299.1 helix-turn-helix transcriptional regulator [Oceanobacter sp. 5_MG-2023]MDP2546539.1 helix-turn-helix transcriptional regulator [Oceanobacter sp. 4_MG-2023]